MAVTYDPIATTTLGSAQATVTFSSIPQTYTDLILITQGRHNSSGVNKDVYLQFNQDTATNYSSTRLYGDGSSALSDRLTGWTAVWDGYWSGTDVSGRSMTITQIMNYSNTTTYKTTLTRQQAISHGSVWATVALWRSTSAVTRLDLTIPSVSFDTGTTFSLFGVKAA
jgi:hypothetical protein